MFLAKKNGLYLPRRTYQLYRSSPETLTIRLNWVQALVRGEAGLEISNSKCLRTISVTTLISSVCEVLSAVAFLDATHVVSLVVSRPRLSVTVGKRIHVEAASLVPEGLERIEPIRVS